MKLGNKITLGFGSLTLIAVILGGIAVVCSWMVKSMATQLAEENVPSVGVANEVERNALQTMLEMRAYGFTEEQKYLDAARANLAQTKKALEKAAEHARKYPNLVVLKANVDKAQAKVAEYEKLMTDTVNVTAAINKSAESMNGAAKDYMDACYEYLAGQDAKVKQEVADLAKVSDADAKGVLERVKKLALGNDVIDAGNFVRIGAFKAIASRDPVDFQEAMKKLEAVTPKLDELKAITRQEADLKQIEKVRAAAKAYGAGMADFLANWKAREELAKVRGKTGDEVTAAARETATTNMEKVETMAASSATTLGAVSTTLIIGLAIAVVLATALAILITRSIVKPVTQIAGVLSAGAEQTSAASTQVASASQQLAQGASEQAAALEETTSAMEEMNSMTKKNAETADQAANIAALANKAAREGDQAMQKMTNAIHEIQESSTKTSGIIKVIDEIAFQTNLLALNAAVEAARAGDAGKGFAVVAAEVRSLAMRSAEAAKNTAAMIEQSVGTAKNGVIICSEVAKLLQEITGHADKVNGLVGEIAAASREQSQGIEQVNKSVRDMDTVTQSSASNAEESASAAEELASQAEQLASAVQQLMSMVHGDKAHTMTATAKAPHQIQSAKKPKSHVASLASAKPHPKASIPLDADEDTFNDFGQARKAA